MTAPDMSRAHWRKSSRSSASGSNCVEVATLAGGSIGVRDSKDPHGPTLLFPTGAWTAFLTTVSGC
ncbi:DUF397 domain-containing protein [Solwaraspora sp. WMMA2080]|uniref:DUF397 domain-containing protein n=1 Tax=unclassified Solwaraspora TaxID=2627926 RepID=UPI00248CBFFB|nr:MULTISPECIES: DUF397 domain-containing protein [unclassified Solwaraspora]WBB97860.1 DUF397 domain-containing protein [Solwaraspora sp. WMMA2059]WBC23580.1 DUF397 domain-containing protein [Solwaraspora sp. WMMA2080]WJK40647.1 DUF397 domain-containing protein [Solwaraspora sp. WMMA2056]